MRLAEVQKEQDAPGAAEDTQENQLHACGVSGRNATTLTKWDTSHIARSHPADCVGGVGSGSGNAFCTFQSDADSSQSQESERQ